MSQFKMTPDLEKAIEKARDEGRLLFDKQHAIFTPPVTPLLPTTMEVVRPKTTGKHKLRGQTESGFQKQVIELARSRGWKVASFRKVRVQRASGATYYETPVAADGRGWPDLFLVLRSRAIAAELKVGRNKETPEQTQWLTLLRSAGIETYTWRPENFDLITEYLR